MFIQLYPNKTLQKTKSFSLLLGAFLTLGGSYSLVRELFLSSQTNILFVYCAAVFFVMGLLSIAFAADKLPLKETYFSMTPERISFRSSFIGQEYVLRWNTIREIKITDQVVVFELKDGPEIIFRLGAVQLPETSKHISTSIRLAALDQNVRVNGVKTERQSA